MTQMERELLAALKSIAAGKTEQDSPFNIMDRGEMQLIARTAIANVKGHQSDLELAGSGGLR